MDFRTEESAGTYPEPAQNQQNFKEGVGILQVKDLILKKKIPIRLEIG